MARPKSAGFDGQREQILAAAAALFARKGYAGATMQAVAEACGVSKATLYHYVRDKQELLAQISSAHVARLEALVQAVAEQGFAPNAPQEHLRALIEAFTAAYADAQNEHRVLTEDVKFLDAVQRERVQQGQRRVVTAFAQAVLAVRPELQGVAEGSLPKALTMLLFGMINWTFIWLKPNGALSHAQLAPIVSELFVAGLAALSLQGLAPARTVFDPHARGQTQRTAAKPGPKPPPSPRRTTRERLPA